MAVLISAVPRHERPRERLLARGAEALTERELLALVIRIGTNGVSALDLAAELLADYGSLAALATARPEELASRKGFGVAKATAVVATFQLATRIAQNKGEPRLLRNAADVVNHDPKRQHLSEKKMVENGST
jgi:DNA repair protein RadC